MSRDGYPHRKRGGVKGTHHVGERKGALLSAGRWASRVRPNSPKQEIRVTKLTRSWHVKRLSSNEVSISPVLHLGFSP